MHHLHPTGTHLYCARTDAEICHYCGKAPDDGDHLLDLDQKEPLDLVRTLIAVYDLEFRDYTGENSGDVWLEHLDEVIEQIRHILST